MDIVSFRRVRGLMVFFPFLKCLIAHSATLDCREKGKRPPRRPPSIRTDRLATVCREWKGFGTFTTLPYSFEPRSRLFGSHLARSQAGTTSARGCYRSRRLLPPYASRRNAPTRAG